MSPATLAPVSAGNRAQRRHGRPAEHRTAQFANFERRTLPDGREEFSGYAAVFGQRSQGLPFVEVIDRGAFTDCLAGDPDVVLVLNHNPDSVIARTSAGNLVLAEDMVGLKVTATLNPADPDAARAIVKLRDGNWTDMSFLFWDLTPAQQRTVTAPDGVKEQHVTRADIDFGDVSIVTYPAYAGTSAEMRARMQGADRAEPLGRVESRELIREALNEVVLVAPELAGEELARRAVARSFTYDDTWTRVDRALDALLGEETYDFYWWIYDIGPDMVVVRAQAWAEETSLETGFWQYSFTIADDGAVTFADPPLEVLPRTVYDPIPALPAPQGEGPEPVGEAPEDDAGDTSRNMTLTEARAAAGPHRQER